MANWIIPFSIGVGATIVGFILTMVWDFFKFRRETQSREQALLNIVQYELSENINILDNDKAILEQELQVLDEHKSVVPPLIPLQSGFWDLLKVNLSFPKKIRNLDSSIKLMRIAQIIKWINEAIQSRQDYRIHSEAMSNYNSRMKIYDEILLQKSEELRKLLNELQVMLK
ncbi:MAG: hypothetical protein V1691_00605 [Chloroflexota bacterium]